MRDPAAGMSRGPDGPGSSGPGLPVRSLVARPCRRGSSQPTLRTRHRPPPVVGRLVRDQLGQASLEVALDLAHEFLSLVVGQLFFKLIGGEQPVRWLWLVVPAVA